MPIKIPSGLPAGEILSRENIFVMDEHRAVTQDIRPLQILVLNPDADEDRNEDIRLFRVSHLLGRTGRDSIIMMVFTSTTCRKSSSACSRTWWHVGVRCSCAALTTRCFLGDDTAQ